MWANAASGLTGKERIVRRVKQRSTLCLDLKNILRKTSRDLSEKIHLIVFQAAIKKCIKETVSDASFRRMMNLMNSQPVRSDHCGDGSKRGRVFVFNILYPLKK